MKENDTPQRNPLTLLKRHIADCDRCGESRDGHSIYLCDEGTELNREITARLEAKDPTVLVA